MADSIELLALGTERCRKSAKVPAVNMTPARNVAPIQTIWRLLPRTAGATSAADLVDAIGLAPSSSSIRASAMSCSRFARILAEAPVEERADGARVSRRAVRSNPARAPEC